MAPSAVSPSARAMMAGVAKYRDDTGGRILTTGTSTAYVVATNSSYGSPPADGTRIGLTFHLTNGSSPTLAVDGGAALAIRVSATDATLSIPASMLVVGSPYDIVYSSTTNSWTLVGVIGSTSSIPIGGMIDYAGNTAPNSNFALCYGQAISRTSYASLFALVGTTFGSGDGTTTFNLPDLRGRASFGKDDMGGTQADRITLAGGNFDGKAVGNSGGLQNHVLTIPELPIVTPSGTISTFTPSGTVSGFTPAGTVSTFTPSGAVGIINGANALNAAGVGVSANVTGGGGAYNIATVTANFSGNSITPTFTGNFVQPTFTGNLLAPNFTGSPFGSGNAHTILPPAMILSKIIRIF